MAVREYLEAFLSDPLVVDSNRAVWWFVRRAIVLPRRSGAVAELYRSIWTAEGAPLLAYSRRQRGLLERELEPDYHVALAMRYGEPSLASAFEELARAGAREVLLCPLFPQYSRSTTGSIEHAAQTALARAGTALRISTIPPFFADPGYVAALAARVRECLAQGPVDLHVFSFHGLPKRYVALGDPYQEHCEASARALAAALGLGSNEWTLVWQSRFGREEWLQPYADVIVPSLAREKPRVLVTCPGFVADCLETLEEVGVRLRAAFLAAGGRELRLTPCLNDHPLWIDALARLISDQQDPGAC